MKPPPRDLLVGLIGAMAMGIYQSPSFGFSIFCCVMLIVLVAIVVNRGDAP